MATRSGGTPGGGEALFAALAAIREKVHALASRYPLYPHLLHAREA